MDRNFALPPIGKAAIVIMILLGAGLPLLVAAGVVTKVLAGALDPLVALATTALVSVAVLAAILPMWRRQVAFDGRRLQVTAAWYRREAPLAQLRLDEARIVDLRERSELRPFIKTNAVALPGLLAGHFRLREWRRKAFCLVTDPARVLALPHADGGVWLLSFEHPQAVLDILRRAAG